MKRMINGLLILTLLMASCTGLADQAPVDEFFRCQTGRICYALPGFPSAVFHENDLPARELENSFLAWNDKIQLNGHGPLGGEYQVHLADMTPSLQWMQEEKPGEEMYQYQANAMMNMVQFYLNIHDGRLVGEVELEAVEGEDILQLTFAYTYPDMPDVPYRGKGYMDGSRAVVMMVQADEENLLYLEDMHPEPLQDGTNAEEMVTAGRAAVTFPEAPLKNERKGHWLYQAFTDDFGYVSFEHMTADFSFMLEDGMTADALLATLAEVAAEGYKKQGVIGDYEIRKVAEGMYAFEGKEEDDRYPEGHRPVASYVMGVFSMDGVYTISASDTEMGRAVYASIRFDDDIHAEK